VRERVRESKIEGEREREKRKMKYEKEQKTARNYEERK
jgi:hypothetical protein